MKYTLTVLGLCIVILLRAQTGNVPEWHYGVKADLNFSTLSGHGTANGYTLGAQGGVFVERAFNSKWSIQPEVLFTQSNTKRSSDFMTYYNTVGNPYSAEDIKLAYLSIPVMLKYNVNKAFSILAGPQYGFLLKDAESLLRSGDGKAFKTGEFSANLGGQFNAGIVSLYARYNVGISNINNIDTRYAWRSSHIQAGIAFRIQ